MAIRTIRTYGDTILRKKCRPVEQIDDRIKTLLADMVETLYNTDNSAGLAAPQIGILKRLVVYDMGEGLVQLINPEIIEVKGEQDVIEGCLSIPGKWGNLKRPEYVKIKSLNENGDSVVIEGEGEIAKCICHELDHLDGILFIDKVTSYL